MKAAVVGGGAWGTAVACQLARCGHDVALWLREAPIADEINHRHTNSLYLGDTTLPERLSATLELPRAVDGVFATVVAIPSEFARKVYSRLSGVLPMGALVVSATKGLELETWLRMTQVAAQELPGRSLAVLSGPSFALEVARELPTAVVVASADGASAESFQRSLSSRCFRVYTSDDVVGVEIAAALKNVVAIAAGILDGLGYGHNTAAALITRGLAEIARLSTAMGGRPDTLAGLAGLGDLVLTCTGHLSRNRRLGRALGEGLSLAQATSPHEVAEGVRTTRAACALAEKHLVEMPICQQMRAVLYEGKPPREALDELMLRTLKRE